MLFSKSIELTIQQSRFLITNSFQLLNYIINNKLFMPKIARSRYKIIMMITKKSMNHHQNQHSPKIQVPLQPSASELAHENYHPTHTPVMLNLPQQ